MEAQPLLADIGDVIGVIITLAIIGFSVISKIIGAANEGKRPPQQRAPQQPPVRARPAAGGPAAKSIEAEIEDFLRQARGGKQPQAPPLPPVEPAPRTIVEATPVVEDVVPGRNFGRDLSDHVSQHIGRDSISQRDAHLGEAVENTDERVEQHLEDVFDHDVGHLAHADAVDTSIAEGTDTATWETKKETKSESAVRIREMLKSPNGIRDVFVAAEILKRPEI